MADEETTQADDAQLETSPSAPHSSSSAPSQIGRYEIDEELGRGGMGVVYRAHDRTLGAALIDEAQTAYRGSTDEFHVEQLIEMKAWLAERGL